MTDQEKCEEMARFMGGILQPNSTCRNYGKMNIPNWAYRLYDFDTLRVSGYEYPISFDWLIPVAQKLNLKTIPTEKGEAFEYVWRTMQKSKNGKCNECENWLTQEEKETCENCLCPE